MWDKIGKAPTDDFTLLAVGTILKGLWEADLSPHPKKSKKVSKIICLVAAISSLFSTGSWKSHSDQGTSSPMRSTRTMLATFPKTFRSPDSASDLKKNAMYLL